MEDPLHHSPQSTSAADGLIITGKSHCVKSTFGIAAVTMTYVLFFWLYFMTLYFGIWH